MAQEDIREKPKFTSPEEELVFLREQVALKEKELKKSEEVPDREKITEEKVKEYEEQKPEEVLAPEYRLEEKEVEGIVLDLAPEEHDEKMNELLGLLQQKGIRNTFSVVERMNNPHIDDDFHRILIQYFKEGFPVSGLDEGGSLWRTLHMTLYEISLPEVKTEEVKQKSLKELLSSMEQFYAGMLSVSDVKKGEKNHFTMEFAISSGGEEVVLYASIPNHKKDLFEKQLLSIFPNVKIHEQTNDYNIFNESGVSLGSYGMLSRNAIFPLKTYDRFDYDPLNVLLNAFSKIEKEGEGAAIQIVFNPAGDFFVKKYKEALEKIQKGPPLKEAVDIPVTPWEKFVKTTEDIFRGEWLPGRKAHEKDGALASAIDQFAVEAIQAKVASPILTANIRLLVSAGTEARAEKILADIEAAFNQFESTQGNRFSFSRMIKQDRAKIVHAFSFREFSRRFAVPLNIKECTTLMHLPTAGVESSPHFRQIKSGMAPAPIDIPREGTVLGVNRFRNVETRVFMSKEDRLRHFYIIGQTGTGKTTLLTNMIAQDIAQGEGVCMIDPHGTDIAHVLSVIPEERFDDVIYFDPGYTKRVMALNMLEYDLNNPQQKTFVVNELFSIFQKLYGAVPESMGPMFEQYFRNATMLVLEDPESGNTLLDVSRVLSDARFRDLKLSRCTNPVVSQFWKDIASKAGGESALANIVPYITSKFDVFLSNEIMRPIIAQPKSSFDFRQIMDERKILLVNLAKGRLGDINSNLIGLIIVGKILMAALSRVDMAGKDVAPFYLYIDEFQNVTTDSIAIILSEARKYKLSLTIAHQFIAQLGEKIRDAVFGNVGSIAAFRVGADDADYLEKQFEPVFSAHDLINLDNRNAYLKLLINGKPAKPFNIETLAPAEGNQERIEQLKELSYSKYGREREEVEQSIRAKFASMSGGTPA